jgi:hypothetical protein
MRLEPNLFWPITALLVGWTSTLSRHFCSAVPFLILTYMVG